MFKDEKHNLDILHLCARIRKIILIYFKKMQNNNRIINNFDCLFKKKI